MPLYLCSVFSGRNNDWIQQGGRQQRFLYRSRTRDQFKRFHWNQFYYQEERLTQGDKEFRNESRYREVNTSHALVVYGGITDLQCFRFAG